jgi:orotate phosphoribosyltransferase
MSDIEKRFLRAAIAAQALRFGEFTLKSGRVSPYFFNAGRFCEGAQLEVLSGCFADVLHARGPAFDMLFGPAYKGITLASATALQLWIRHQRSAPFAFNRKEAKDHGEGGSLIGAPLAGRVVIVDDVISAGTSVRESVEIIQAAGAEPVAVLIALDRQERGTGDDPRSAAQQVHAMFGIPVLAVANLSDLLHPDLPEVEPYRDDLLRYRENYGAGGLT